MHLVLNYIYTSILKFVTHAHAHTHVSSLGTFFFLPFFPVCIHLRASISGSAAGVECESWRPAWEGNVRVRLRMSLFKNQMIPSSWLEIMELIVVFSLRQCEWCAVGHLRSVAPCSREMREKIRLHAEN